MEAVHADVLLTFFPTAYANRPSGYQDSTGNMSNFSDQDKNSKMGWESGGRKALWLVLWICLFRHNWRGSGQGTVSFFV